jgi:calcineurin-like phosphoesterase family protein
MMWFTSDTHFGHANIIQYTGRPFEDVTKMNDALIKNWNDRVAPDDEVWHLGDFAFMKLTELRVLLRRLNGRVNVVLGNHDAVISNNAAALTHDTEPPLLASVQAYKELKHDGENLVLFHYGMRVWNRAHHGSILLYGHSHGSLPPHGRSVDVGVDCKEITPEYRPVSIDEVMRYMSKRTPVRVDHHGEQREQ